MSVHQNPGTPDPQDPLLKHFRPRHSLGQAFLTYEPMADALVDALNPGPADTVLEIGPGKGILTRRLVALAGRVIAVEIDERLVSGLRTELGGNPNLEVVHADFMDFDMSDLRRLKILGNLPYNLSSQMLFKLLDSVHTWDSAVLTTQREFAYRVVAAPGTKAFGALSVFFDRLVERERLFNIEPRCFKPHPDVVSTSFRLTRRVRPLYAVADEALFRRTVKACFAQRRKTIANNLVAGLGLTRDAAVEFLRQSGIDPAARAETVTGGQFKELLDALDGKGFPGSRVGFSGPCRTAQGFGPESPDPGTPEPFPDSSSR